MSGIRTRFIAVNGWQRRTKVTWRSPGGCGKLDGKFCESETRVIHVGDGEIPSNSDVVEHELRDGPLLWTPEACSDCGKPFVPRFEYDDGDESLAHMLTWTLERMSTPSGEPEIGDVWYASDAASNGRSWGHFISHELHDPSTCGIDDCTAAGPLRCKDTRYSDGRIHTRGWHNCDGRHVLVKVPGGAVWDVDSRGGNCTMPDDVLHRCWVRVGDPELGTLHIAKDGLTCAAGAGSILTHNYHGFLHHGVLSPTG